MDILQQITKLREERNWSEYRLAKEANLPQSTLLNLSKRCNSPTVPTLEAICGAFGISLSQFFAQADEGGDLTEEQKQLLDNWTLLSKTQKKTVMAYIYGLLQKNPPIK
ncbi:MAG: helix-turn-helix transcriptional regulator [Desulfuromonadales bacterium]|nr:helix-turn-helix transcriptional regulator [Desulfuromonadales bacterium]